MTRAELTTYRHRLTALAADLGDKLTGLRVEALRPTGGGMSPTADDGMPAEQAALTLLGTEGHLLAEVNEAIDRLDRGTFGQCAGCRRPIGKARLDALPYASRCVGCARRVEAAPNT